MGQKINPISFRLGGVNTWSSRWFAVRGQYRTALHEDLVIRKFLKERLKDASITKIDIERSRGVIVVNLFTAKPGLVIGRGGQGVEVLQREIKAKLFDEKTNLQLNIQEIDKPNLSASLALYAIKTDIEKRIPFRRAMRQAMSRLTKAGAAGVKIQVAGRLNGAEIARTEKASFGTLPLHTIRANIDYFRGTAQTTYGVIGIKVWVYRGDEVPNTPVKSRSPHSAKKNQ